MGVIILDRENNFIGAIVKYNIFLDNNKIGSISNGKVATFEIESGYHTLYVENATLSSGISNIIEFNMTNSKIINISVKVAFSRSGIKLKIENEKDDNSKEESKYEKILRLNELKNKNIITEDEFEQEKSKLLKGD